MTGEQMWRRQSEVVRALARFPRVAVASCNGAGKSFLAARAVVWFLCNFQPSVVLTTAPTDRQVRRILWKEIHVAVRNAQARGNRLGGRLLTKEWYMGGDHWALGFSARDYDATAFQGMHSPHLLVVVDEAAGVTDDIWEGVYSVLKGGFHRLLAIGNPTNLGGEFYKAFQNERWWTTHISAFDTPNLAGQGVVVPGLVTDRDVQDAREDWGTESPLYQARVLGQFPDTAEDTLIPISLVERAAQQGDPDEDEDRDLPVEIGADHARYGTDENVYVARRGARALAWEAFGAGELGTTGVMAATGRLVRFARQVLDGEKDPKQSLVIKCDAVGLGGGVPDRLREMQLSGEVPSHWIIEDLNAGARAERADRYADAATEWWHDLADRLRSGRAYGPVFGTKRAVAQLSQRRYQVTSDGRTRLESKDKVKSRGLQSPDWGDAIAMAYAQTRRRARVLDGPARDLLRGVKLYG